MSSKPSQLRTIDPFAEYNSNVANRMTRMLSGNDNVLMSTNSLQLSLDTTSPTTVVVVQTGTAFKDDVFIEIPAEHQVDMEDPENYYTVGELVEAGYYYIVLEYTYVKSRPAPEVHIKIIKPSQRPTTLPGGSMFLGVVKVIPSGLVFRIDTSDPFENFDDTVGYENNKREYVKSYVGTETNLPTHVQKTDQSRMAYDSETDKFWLGYRDHWTEFGTGGSVINIDTTSADAGDLCYADVNAEAQPALATANNTGADIVVQSVGLAIDSSGKGLTSGIAEDVPVEGAVIITAGDLLYLSASQAGKVTNVKTAPYYQVIGRALTTRVGAGPVDIIFTPKVLLATALMDQITAGASWTLSGGNYYADVDISIFELGSDSAILSNFYDSATDMQISPLDVELRDSGDTLRIWMGVNTIDLNYIIATGGGGNFGGSGGGGGSDHSLLTNLSFGASGHVGFASDPHDNTQHSAAYITGTGVTYGNLLANGDIGTGSTQVSQGNHTHTGLIPSGTVMLFYQASAPVAWTLKTTGFNNNSMICIGTSLATGGSEDARSFNPAISTNAVGNHSHSITTQASHTHNYSGTTSVNSGSGKDQGGGSNDCAPHPHTHTFSGATTGGGSHNHGGNTGNGGTHSHSVNYDTYNPWYVRVIAATKD